jgi:hypothetical protein
LAQVLLAVGGGENAFEGLTETGFELLLGEGVYVDEVLADLGGSDFVDFLSFDDELQASLFNIEVVLEAFQIINFHSLLVSVFIYELNEIFAVDKKVFDECGFFRHLPINDNIFAALLKVLNCLCDKCRLLFELRGLSA